MDKNQSVGITNVEIRIAIGVVICLFVCHFAPSIDSVQLGGMSLFLQPLAACTAVVMCTQDIDKATWNSGLTRLLGVICGGVSGILVAVIDGFIGNDYIFYVLCGFGLLLNALLGQLVKLPSIAIRVSMISFCLVTLLTSGNARIMYAADRFVGTLFGALVAWIIALIWTRIRKQKV